MNPANFYTLTVQPGAIVMSGDFTLRKCAVIFSFSDVC